MSIEDFPDTTGLSAEEIELLAYLLDEEGVEAPQRQQIFPRDQQADLPLSFAQERLWFLDQWQPNDPTYNIAVAVSFHGRLDIAVLRRSLDAIIQRHDSLRTTFSTVAGRTVQLIAQAGVDAPAVPLRLIDLQGLPEAQRAAAARRLSMTEGRHLFDLTRGPLLSTTLLRLRPTEHVFLLIMHHIISDGWSMGVFFRELTALYEAYSSGQPEELPALPIQYADFAIWQRGWLLGADGAAPSPLETQLAYWRQRLAGLSVLELPTDHARPAVQSFRGARHPFQFPCGLADDLAALSQRAGVTEFMTLLAAFQVLLHRYTGQNDIVVGAPIANRTKPEIEPLIGFFVNTLVLRTDLSGRPAFRELLQQVRELTLGAYAHQDLPFEKLVEDLHPSRDLSRTALFQVSFVMHNTGMKAPELREVVADMRQIDNGTSKFDLSLIVEETDARLTGDVEYSTDLFDAATITRLLGHFQVLLEGIVADPDQRVATLRLLTAAEQTQLLVGWNPTPSEEPDLPSFPTQFAVQAAHYPDAIALVAPAAEPADGEQYLTYSELNRRANQLAHYLRELGVGPEVRVGLCLERGLALVIGLLGVLKAGGAYVPLDPAAPAERLAFMLEDAQLAVLITQRSIYDLRFTIYDLEESQATIVNRKSKIVNIDADWPWIAASAMTDPPALPTQENLAYLIYTSGTTGQPKAVLVEHRQLTQLLAACQQQFGLAPNMVVPWIAPVVFDITLFELGLPLAMGGTVLVLSREQVLDLTGLLSTLARCTMLHSVPSLMQQIVAAGPPAIAAYDQMRQVFVGGELVPPALLAALPTVFRRADIWVLYGPTEATILSTCYRAMDGVQLERPLIGQPLPHVQLQVQDRNGQLVPAGVAGELCISGAGVTRGYHNRPELTAERFVPNPFPRNQGSGVRGQESGVRSQKANDQRPTTNDQTDHLVTLSPCHLVTPPGARLYKSGDRVRYRADGVLEFLGRIDDQVKVRGFRIELGEIEAVLTQYAAVRAATLLAREDTPGAVRLVAYVVPRERPAAADGQLRESVYVGRRSPLADDLQAFVQARLPEYMVPSAFVLLDALPLTPSGKIDRKALPAPEQDPGGGVDYVAPRSPLEELLASLWADVLGLPRVGIHDSFFALGGHSLLATQLLVRLRQALQVQLPIRALFEAPSVAALAERVVAARRAAEPLLLAPPLQPLVHEAPPPLAFAQERLWFLDQLAPGNPFYNTALAVRMDGRLDLPAFTRTISTITKRHAILRTTFAPVDGRPVQVIAPYRPFALPLIDLRALPDQERKAAAQRLTTNEARRPFDLVRGPLLRVSLIRLNDAEHWLLLTAHHSVFDGWSTAVFVREVQALYSAFVRGDRGEITSPLPPPIQYADYALWQRTWLQGAVLEAQLGYWREQLRNAPAVLDLPTDYPRPPAQTFRGARFSFTLAPELSRGLVTLSQKAGVTLFMLLLAAWQVLLGRYSNQDDLSVGVPIAGRTQAELEGLIGFFVNTLVLRADLSGNPTFSELLERLRAVVLGAYEHQDVPFEMVVEAVQPPRSLSHSPLFQTMFTLQNVPQAALDLPGLTLTPLEAEGGAALFDLMLGMIEVEHGLSGALVYNTDLFAGATIAGMLDQFKMLLEAIVADPDRRLTDLPLIGDAERQRLRQSWRATTPGAERIDCIHRLFEEQVARTPDAVAVVFDATTDQRPTTNDQRPTTNGRPPTTDHRRPSADGNDPSFSVQLTYQELNRRANQLAHHLRGLGVGPEVAVGICLDPSPELLISLLGVLKAGGVCVPLGPSYPLERIVFMLEDSGARVVLTMDNGSQTKRQGDKELDDLRVSLSPGLLVSRAVVDLRVDWPAIAGSGAENPHGGATTANLAHLSLTLEAHGKTRGALAEHRQLCHLAGAQIRAAAIRPGDRVLPYLAESTELYLPLLAGATLCLSAPDAPVRGATALRLARAHAVSTLLLPSTLISALPAEELPALHTLIVAGHDASPTVLARWASGRKVYIAYGPPEARLWAPLVVATPARQRLVVGSPATPTALYLLDEQGQPVPSGVPGDLCIGGAGLARGYLGRPELTAERFVPNPFVDPTTDDRRPTTDDGTLTGGRWSVVGGRLCKSGDVARRLPDGTFELFGPRERHIRVRGFPVDQGVIAEVLNRHPAVRESVVMARADLPGASSLVAYVVPTNDQRPTTNEESAPSSFVLRPSSLVGELRAFLKQRLPDYMLPATIVLLDELPLTPGGALDTAALPPPAAEAGPAAQAAAPRTSSPDLASRQANLSARRAELSSAKQTLLEQRLRGKLQRTTNSSPVVPIQPAGTRRPLFCVHPVGGTVLCYVELVRRLGADQPVYGLQSAGLDGSRSPATCIEDMATHYLASLRSIQPDGPYLLGGWSLGGVVAFEMAQQLRQSGEAATLYMIDCMAPVPPNMTDLVIDDEKVLLGFLQDLAGRLGKPVPLSEADLRQHAPEARTPYLIERARQAQLLPPDADAAQLQRTIQVYKANVEAMARYRPQPYPGRMILLRAEEELHRSFGDRTLGWGTVATGPTVIEVIPGNHYTILNPPQVQALAACMTPYLADAEPD